MNQIELLFVEDDPVILRDIASMLPWEEDGFRVRTASNGRRGLELFAQEPALVVVTDIRMPFMDGLEMIAEMQKLCPYTSFLVFSAYREFDYAHEALQLGVLDYIIKATMTPQSVREKVDKAVLRARELLCRQVDAIDARVKELLRTNDISREAFEQYLSPCDLVPNEWLLYPLVERLFLAGITGEGRLESTQQVVDSLLLYQREEAKRQGDTSAYSPLVRNAVEYMKRNYSKPDLKISDVAAAVRISQGRLSVRFREETGETVLEFLTRIRIDAAKQLLRQGYMRVNEVAEAVGYQNMAYFSSIFRKMTGETPVQYMQGTE